MTNQLTKVFQTKSKWLYVLILSRMRFRVNAHSIVPWMSRNSKQTRNPSLSDCNWTRTHNHLVHKRTLNHLAKQARFVYELSGRGFGSSYNHSKSRWFNIMLPLQLQTQSRELLERNSIKKLELSHYVFMDCLDVIVLLIT